MPSGRLGNCTAAHRLAEFGPKSPQGGPAAHGRARAFPGRRQPVASAESSGRSSGRWPRSWSRRRSSTDFKPSAGCAFGRTKARETEPIRPVADLYVAIVLPFVTPHVAAMIKLQRLSGMRAGEMVVMRPCDIDTSGEIWIYEPFDHKGRWRGHRKQIPLGPEAQRILQPFLGRDPQAFLFSPAGG